MRNPNFGNLQITSTPSGAIHSTKKPRRTPQRLHQFEVYFSGRELFVHPGTVAIYDRASGYFSQGVIVEGVGEEGFEETLERITSVEPTLKGGSLRDDEPPSFNPDDDTMQPGTQYRVIAYIRTDLKVDMLLVEKDSEEQPEIEGYENKPCDIMYPVADVKFKIESGELAIDELVQLQEGTIAAVFTSPFCGDESSDESDESDESDSGDESDDSNPDSDGSESDESDSSSESSDDEECDIVPTLGFLEANIAGYVTEGNFEWPDDPFGGPASLTTIIIAVSVSYSSICRGCATNGEILFKITGADGSVAVPIDSAAVITTYRHQYWESSGSCEFVFRLPRRGSCGFFKISAEIVPSGSSNTLVGDCKIKPEHIKKPVYTFINVPYYDGSFLYGSPPASHCGLHPGYRLADPDDLGSPSIVFILFDRAGRYLPYGINWPVAREEDPYYLEADTVAYFD